MTWFDERGLRRLVAGDLAPLAALRETPRDELVRVARAATGLVVTVAAVSNVLEARRAGTAVVADTWRWAKLLLHATHPYIGPAMARDSDPAGAQEALEAWMADHAPEFQLTYEDGHDHAIALALYRDRGDEPQLVLDDARIDGLERPCKHQTRRRFTSKPATASRSAFSRAGESPR